MSLGKQSCCNKQLLLLRSSSLQQRQVPLMSVRLPWVVEKWEGGGGGRMHSPMRLLAEKLLRCVSAPGCGPQPTLVGAQLLSMISKTHVLAAPWAPAAVGGGVSPYSFPFPHAHVSGWGSLATVCPPWGYQYTVVPKEVWEQPKCSASWCKQSAEKMPADGAPVHSASLRVVKSYCWKLPCFEDHLASSALWFRGAL